MAGRGDWPDVFSDGARRGCGEISSAASHDAGRHRALGICGTYNTRERGALSSGCGTGTAGRGAHKFLVSDCWRRQRTLMVGKELNTSDVHWGVAGRAARGSLREHGYFSVSIPHGYVWKRDPGGGRVGSTGDRNERGWAEKSGGAVNHRIHR